jgi:hypothetical protein
LSRRIFLDQKRRRGRDPLPLVRILQTWTHFWEKGAANLTSSGPCGGRCVGIQMYSQWRWGIQYPRVEDTSPTIRWDRVLAEAGNPVVTRSPDCNHFLSRRRLRIARLQELRCRGTAMKLEVLLKVARPDDHPLLLGPAIHLRISLVEPHLNLPFIIRRMMTM